MALVSVVIPVFNSAPFVEDTLASVAAQTHRDLDVVVVDNGSTDGTDDLVARFTEKDSRFQLVREAGKGPGRARNTGMAAARGELMTFADGDDLVPPNAYELLLTTLQQTGSDFAAGNFRRLTSIGLRPAHYMGKAFAKPRMRTHIRDFHDLVRDRTLWNKLYRRDFLDKHELRLGELEVYNDQSLTLPAYFLATSVDILSAPVYYWRVRDTGGLSLSQLRQTPYSIGRRVTAIRDTSRFLAMNFPEEKRWYEQSVVQQDLALLPDVVVAADADDRAAVLDVAVDWLDQTEAGALDELPALRRVAWTLVHRRATDQLAELLRFEREDLPRSSPVRRWGHWYGDYPFFRDRRSGLARSLFRVDDELDPSVRVADVEVDAAAVTIDGFARLGNLPVRERRAQTITCTAASAGQQPVALDVVAVARPDLAVLEPAEVGEWGGFRATLPLSALAERTGRWALSATVRRRAATGTTEALRPAPLHPVRSRPALTGDGRQVRVELAGGGQLHLFVEEQPPTLIEVRVDDAALVLTGSLPSPVTEATLRARGTGGKRTETTARLTDETSGQRFQAALPLESLLRDFDDPLGPLSVNRPQLELFELELAIPRGTHGLGLHEQLPEQWLAAADREWSVSLGRRGCATLRQRTPRATVTAVEHAAGRWLLRGSLAAHGPDALVLTGPDHRSVDVHEVETVDTGSFAVTLPEVTTLCSGTWQLEAAVLPPDVRRFVPLGVDDALVDSLPMWRLGDRVRSGVGVSPHLAPALFVA